MKILRIIACAFFCTPLLLLAGCEQPGNGDKNVDTSAYVGFAPAKVRIILLTELTRPSQSQEEAKLNVYVSLIDLYGCQKRAPGVFRFELYERILRAAEPKGRRIVIWPDIDLTNSGVNNGFWRDFLRAYEFSLNFEHTSSQGYILQVTFLCPTGRRLSAEYVLK